MSKKIKVDKKLAQKVIDVVTPGLCNGLGDPTPGKMCVEAAVNYACGLEHDDSPPCVGGSVRNFKINLNDGNWSSNKARAKGMIKIAIAQLGSNKLNQDKFEELIVEEFTQLAFRKKFDKIVNNKKLSILNKISEIKENFYEIENFSYDDLVNNQCLFNKMSTDKYLTLLADICLTVLKKMKSPGCKYLYLLNKYQ